MIIVFLLFASGLNAQFRFSGEINEMPTGTPVYLSLVEDYRKLNRVYLEQVIRRTTVDSVGFFEFSGDQLYTENRIYRIHVDSCNNTTESGHFLGMCDDVQSVLFLANNRDSIHFPSGFENELFCSLTSTNPDSGVFLDLDMVKEEMVLDFAQFNSEANRQLNLNKWFAKWQDIGTSLNDPLGELYIYELLSDKRNPTYNYYLNEVSTNPYYDQLSDRLGAKYPNAPFTNFYSSEISADRQLASFRHPSDSRVEITIYILLAVSVLLNLLLFMRWRKSRYRKNNSLQKLTKQERRIVDHILSDMSNKEIAEKLFVSVSTVKTHINNLYKKLEVTDRNDIKTLFKK